MRTENELIQLALIASGEVTTVEANFGGTSRTYTYVSLRAVAEVLRPDDLILVERGGEQGLQLTVARVKNVHREPKFDKSISYSWVLASLRKEEWDLERLKVWAEQLMEVLADAQRRKTREAVLAEFGGLLPTHLPGSPALLASEDADAEKVRPEFKRSAKAYKAAHETPDNGYGEDDEPEEE